MMTEKFIKILTSVDKINLYLYKDTGRVICEGKSPQLQQPKCLLRLN
jgi:hypothetical protein